MFILMNELMNKLITILPCSRKNLRLLTYTGQKNIKEKKRLKINAKQG